MLTYNDLYEYLRKEKYSDQLQSLPKDFIMGFSEYCVVKRKQFNSSVGGDDDMFNHDILRDKKQFENAIALFKELMLRRKKKILNLVFVAAETGIMKKDFNDMLVFEKELFEKLVAAVDDGDKALNGLLNGKTEDNDENKMIIVGEEVEEFVDMDGKVIGPFKQGSLVNLDKDVAEILVNGGRARFIDE